MKPAFSGCWRGNGATAAFVALLFFVVPILGAAAAPAAVNVGSCPIVSGYVYEDENDNGLRDTGEPPLGGGTMVLRTAAGEVAGTAVAGADGFYQFSIDESRTAPEKTVNESFTVSPKPTNWTDIRQVPPFDAALGTLVAVDISQTATITSSIEAESLDGGQTTLTATVSGEVSVGLGANTALAVPAVEAGQFTAGPYDGQTDFAGVSGHDFGAHTASDTGSITITGPALQAFRGSAPVGIAASARATSNTTGSGNVVNRIGTVAGVDVRLGYRYSPYVCLAGGTYTIIQRDQPAGYGDGRETAGNSFPIPNSKGSDQITVQVENADLSDNNFGEITGSLSGHVYVDLDNDGVFDDREQPIPDVTVRLVGKDVSGHATDLVFRTTKDGYYLFGGLVAGSYELIEVQPSKYLDGKDTIGSQGGVAANDDFKVELAAGEDGVDNNFGELLAPTQVPSPTVVAAVTETPNPPSSSIFGNPGPSAPPAPRAVPTPSSPGSGSGLAIGADDIGWLLALLVIAAATTGCLFVARGRPSWLTWRR